MSELMIEGSEAGVDKTDEKVGPVPEAVNEALQAAVASIPEQRQGDQGSAERVAAAEAFKKAAQDRINVAATEASARREEKATVETELKDEAAVLGVPTVKAETEQQKADAVVVDSEVVAVDAPVEAPAAVADTEAPAEPEAPKVEAAPGTVEVGGVTFDAPKVGERPIVARGNESTSADQTATRMAEVGDKLADQLGTPASSAGTAESQVPSPVTEQPKPRKLWERLLGRK